MEVQWGEITLCSGCKVAGRRSVRAAGPGVKMSSEDERWLDGGEGGAASADNVRSIEWVYAIRRECDVSSCAILISMLRSSDPRWPPVLPFKRLQWKGYAIACAVIRLSSPNGLARCRWTP